MTQAAAGDGCDGNSGGRSLADELVGDDGGDGGDGGDGESPASYAELEEQVGLRCCHRGIHADEDPSLVMGRPWL